MKQCPACDGCPQVAVARDGIAKCAPCYLHEADPEQFDPCPHLTPGDP